jgi:type 1 fimbriae regulatory protein FimB/type 1 fimbriae regulatory protein FimE
MNPPPKVPNADRRSREHLTPAEIDRLIAAARRLGRHGDRDAAMILLAYRHGLRVSELVGLRREQVDLPQGLLHVRRRKNGLPSTHPLRGPELRALREVLRAYPDGAYVFISERGAPMTAATFRKLVARAGDAAKLGMPIHPHMLRHSTGFKLANDGQDTRAIQLYLGHKNIQYTALYGRTETVMAEPSRAWTEFSGVWAYISRTERSRVSYAVELFKTSVKFRRRSVSLSMSRRLVIGQVATISALSAIRFAGSG